MTLGFAAALAIVAIIALGILLFEVMRRKAASDFASLARRVEPQGPSLAP
jgi:hypothetical protein